MLSHCSCSKGLKHEGLIQGSPKFGLSVVRGQVKESNPVIRHFGRFVYS